MDIRLETVSHGGSLVLDVVGNVKSPSDANMIRAAIEKASSEHPKGEIVLRLRDSFIITSSVIGFLVKFINKDKLNIVVEVGNEELFIMLEEMELHRLFRARRFVQ